jgi:hypothetical protein
LSRSAPIPLDGRHPCRAAWGVFHGFGGGARVSAGANRYPLVSVDPAKAAYLFLVLTPSLQHSIGLSQEREGRALAWIFSLLTHARSAFRFFLGPDLGLVLASADRDRRGSFPACGDGSDAGWPDRKKMCQPWDVTRALLRNPAPHPAWQGDPWSPLHPLPAAAPAIARLPNRAVPDSPPGAAAGLPALPLSAAARFPA